MSTMLIAFNGTREFGQFFGDTITSVRTAFLFAESLPCSRYLLALSPKGDLNFLWNKFIDTYKCEIFYDTFHPGNAEQRFHTWNKWRRERKIDGVAFDHYRELYRRIDGGHRQREICGDEKGLGRRNIFEYFFYGQEWAPEECPKGATFGDDLIYHPERTGEFDVLIAPYAKCQGNAVFTFGFWEQVVRGLIDQGIGVTVNYNGGFCEDLNGHALYRKTFPGAKDLMNEVVRYKLVSCGNTGVGWYAAAAGVPLLAMQPPDSNMQDYRYEWCGVKSLIEYVEFPDADYVVERIRKEVRNVLVLTTGCFDVIHAGHVRHLEESRSLGDRLVVALNSDASVKALKGPDRPYHDQKEREVVLRALSCVDDVVVFDGPNALELITRMRPGVLTNGCDHKLEDIVGRDFVESYGGKVVVTSGTRTTASTATVAKLRKVAPPAETMRVVQEAAALSPSPVHKLRLMADQYLETLKVEGHVADLGTYRGACGLILRRLGPDKVLHLFDTWAGNPHPDPLCDHKVGEWPASLEDCKKVVGEEKVVYHKGIFPASAEGLEDLAWSFVVVDMDTYQSTRDAIEWFWPKVSKGGKMYFDDYDWKPCGGVKVAVDEVFKEKKVFTGSHACVVTKSL